MIRNNVKNRAKKEYKSKKNIIASPSVNPGVNNKTDPNIKESL